MFFYSVEKYHQVSLELPPPPIQTIFPKNKGGGGSLKLTQILLVFYFHHANFNVFLQENVKDSERITPTYFPLVNYRSFVF